MYVCMYISKKIRSSSRYLAQMTQCPYVVSLVSTPMAALTLNSVSIFMFCWAAKALSYASRDEADMYCFTSSGVC